MVLIAFRHGLRASELVDLRWDQVDLEHALLHVRRLKNGSPATHPLTGKELRALRRLQREQDTKSQFVFTSERGTPFTKRGFQAMVERAGEAAGFDMKIQRLQHGATAFLRPDLSQVLQETLQKTQSLDPRGRPLRLPDCPGFRGFKLGYTSIVSHRRSGKLCGDGSIGHGFSRGAAAGAPRLRRAGH